MVVVVVVVVGVFDLGLSQNSYYLLVLLLIEI